MSYLPAPHTILYGLVALFSLHVMACQGPCPKGANFASGECDDPNYYNIPDQNPGGYPWDGGHLWDDGYYPPPCPGAVANPYALSPCPDIGYPEDLDGGMPDMDMGREDQGDLSLPDMSDDMDALIAPRFKWARTGGGPGNADDIGAIASDSKGNVYISGTFEGTISIGDERLSSRGMSDIFVASYDQGGSLRWVQQFGSTGEDHIFGAACDGRDELVLSGQFEGTVNFGGQTLTSQGLSDAVVMKMTAQKQVIWAKRFGGASSDSAKKVAIDSQDHIILGIDSQSDIMITSVNLNAPLQFANAGSQDAYVLKLDEVGEALWGRQIAGEQDDHVMAITVTRDDAVLCGGDFEGDSAQMEGDSAPHAFEGLGGTDAWMSQWGSDGTYQWHRAWGGSGDDTLRGLAHNPQGGSFVAGTFTQRATFHEVRTLEAQGGQDLYLMKIEDTGQLVWLRHTRSLQDIQGARIAATQNGGVIMGGSLRDDASLQDGDERVDVATNSDATLQPLLVSYDAQGELVSHTLLNDVRNGRFDELAVSGDLLFLDLVYRSDNELNAINGESLPALGEKDFALVSYTLP